MDPEIILLDEPTSALDPTMVGEVQAVIRNLSTTGKTMMIVTHEMAFARAICNRVFYMDEGGIYEDGTPEEIFEHPKRENTRRFVRRLKVLELDIRNKDYDFLGMATQISEYCRKNQISPKLENRTQLAFEELVEQLLRRTMGITRIQVVLEYSEAKDQMTMIVRSGGSRLDGTPDEENLSIQLIQSAVKNVEIGWEEGSELPNRIVLQIRSEEQEPGNRFLSEGEDTG